MKNMNTIKIGTTALLLAACGSAGDISERNPDYFGATLKKGTITGSYNPSGFSSKTVQAQIKSVCVNNNIGSYAEGAGSNGLIRFQASCAQGSELSIAFVEVERMPSGNYTIEITGS